MNLQSYRFKIPAVTNIRKTEVVSFNPKMAAPAYQNSAAMATSGSLGVAEGGRGEEGGGGLLYLQCMYNVKH